MEYVEYEHLRRDTSTFKDGDIFTVVRKENETWAFAMKIKGNYTLTIFQPYTVDKFAVERARKQILFCKKYGWSYIGKKAWNFDNEDYEHEFMCMYCKRSGFETSQPCACRNTKIEDMLKKTKSGIILPF